MNRQHMEVNRQLWDAWAPHHVTSDFYDVDAFRAGASTLKTVEVDGVGNVDGKSLLHLQCHFGLDTLSWARLGARVTGVDFSLPAIEAARSLAHDVGLPATFVHSNIYDLPDHLQSKHDVVFTSSGVLGWLPDIQGWSKVIAHFLRPGGIFFIYEVHPFALLFDEERNDRELRLRWPYFHEDEPLEFADEISYAAPETAATADARYWVHSMSDIIGSLLSAGLVLESFEENDFLSWPQFGWMEERQDGYWALPPGSPDIPLSFILRARKRR
jgi:2-polyprenyl-3-methyl-5-hydroxy-6-metoxy-1,4-benzoquinol methylase